MYRFERHPLGQFVLITVASLITVVGVYYFKFPNNFSFGGVTGIAVVAGKLTAWGPATVNLVLNVLLLIVGFAFLGRSFGVKTVYASLLMSGAISLLEYLHPLSAPLTQEPMLEFILAIFLPSVGAAAMFNIGASGGGTDIPAMILRKHTGINAGSALLLVDCVISLATFFVFDIQTGLFAVVGLLVKSFLINGTIESINLNKYFIIICDDANPICEYINAELKRGATVSDAVGAFTHNKKHIVFTALRRNQAIHLRRFIKETEPSAFIMICNSSEIIGHNFME